MEKFLRWFRACGHCGSVVGPINGLCDSCFEKVLCSISVTNVVGHPFRVQSLLEWTEDREIVGNLVRSLKGAQSNFAYSVLAYELASHAELRGVTIVVPPSKRGDRDHAWTLGSMLADLSGTELLSPFRVESGTDQKLLNKLERAALSFTLTEKVPSSNILFVDDLITTGATARAAWQALGKPKGFSVWTVACRPLRNQL